MTEAIRLQGFSLVQDRKTILKDLSLTVSAGEKVALVGPSGAGKSSLLLALYGQLRQSAAWCPQQPGLVESLSVYHNIYMGRLEQSGVWKNICNLIRPLTRERAEVEDLSERFGLRPLLDEKVMNLSGGEQQRVSLARACYRRQPIFLGDEPVASLDPQQGSRILRQVLEQHPTAVVALHSPELALDNFDRLIGLRHGQIQFDQPVTALTPQWLTEFYRG